MSTAQHRRLAKKKKAPATHSPAQQRAQKKRMWWSRPTRGGGEAQMLEQAHERRWSGATEYPNIGVEWVEWSVVGGVK